MNLARVVFALSDILSIILICRLVALRLHDVYRVFCAFLVFEIVSESFVMIEKFTALDRYADYRITWIGIEIVSWVFSIWMVYALLRAILRRLPGILRWSRRALNISLALALLIACVTAAPEFVARGPFADTTPLVYAVLVCGVLERLVATIALLTLLFTLAFILWFPVTMPRNLAVFSIGFGVYFTAKTTLLLIRSFWLPQSAQLLGNWVALIFCICLLYWIIFLNRAGENSPITLGHSWQATRQAELLRNMEHLNAILVRSGRR